jgi:hypothetical protein
MWVVDILSFCDELLTRLKSMTVCTMENVGVLLYIHISVDEKVLMFTREGVLYAFTVRLDHLKIISFVNPLCVEAPVAIVI